MKKLVVMFLGIFMVVALAGCGGGRHDDDDDKGESMSPAQLASRYGEVSKVEDAIYTAANCVTLFMGSGSRAAKSQIVRADSGDEDDALLWSHEPDKDGWYTATQSEGGYTDTYKMRYIAKTKTIELVCTWTGTEEGTTVSGKYYTRASLGTDGLYSGYITHAESGGASQKIEFSGLNLTNNCGVFTLWVNDKKRASFTLTMAGADMHISGSTFDENGNETKIPDQVITPPTGEGGGGGAPPPTEG
jgi:hypothetical protein